MSMTELERRCVDAANAVSYCCDEAGTWCQRPIDVVRAVLAEAGVAELVEALRDVQALITEVMDLERIGAAQAIEEMAQIVNAALTGAAS